MAKRERDNTEYRDMLLRMIRAYGERVAQADDWDLNEMLTVQGELDRAVARAVQGQREMGRSWAYIGVGLGVTRQAAQMKYGKPAA